MSNKRPSRFTSLQTRSSVSGSAKKISVTLYPEDIAVVDAVCKAKRIKRFSKALRVIIEWFDANYDEIMMAKKIKED